LAFPWYKSLRWAGRLDFAKNKSVGSQELQNLLQKLLLLMWQTTIDGNIIATSDAIY
jgi:hypothetical protein